MVQVKRPRVAQGQRVLEFCPDSVAQCAWVVSVMLLRSGKLSDRLSELTRRCGDSRYLPRDGRRHWSAPLLAAAILASSLAFGLLVTSLKAQAPGDQPLRAPTTPPQPPQSPDFVMQRLMRLRAERQAGAPEQAARPVPAQATPAQVPMPQSGPQVPAPQSQAQALPPVSTPEPMKVDYSKGLLSVSAERVPLSQVLQAISQQTGLQVHGLQEAGQPVSVHFSDTPVSQGVQNLLADKNYVLLGDLASAQDVRQARVVLLNPTSGADIDMGDAGRPPPPAVNQAQRALWRSQLMSKNPAEQDAAFREISRLGPREAFDALKDVLDNGDGVARLRALQLMDQDGQLDRAAVGSVIGAALDDHDTVLRDYAIQALGRETSAESLNLLRQQLDSSDANARLNVVQAVSQRPDARPLLQQAASDPDPSVSALANELLHAGDAASPDAQSPQPEPQQPDPQQPEPQPEPPDPDPPTQ